MGVFSANQLKFDKHYLKELTNQPTSGVFEQQCKYHIALHPAQLNDFGQSIKDELSKKIGRYDESFDGILLGFQNIKLQSDIGIIGSDNCYIHLDLHACFFVFRPKLGMVLEGTVTRTTKDHVGCLIYNTFNVSLPRPDNDDGSWMGASASAESEVKFKIIHVNLFTRLPHIRGEIESIVGGSGKAKISLYELNKKKRFQNWKNDSEQTASDDQPSIKKKAGKSRNANKSQPTEYANESGVGMEQEIKTELPLKESKKKRKDKQEVSQLEDVEADEIAVKSQRKLKKEKRRQKQNVLGEDELDLSSESLRDFKNIVEETTSPKKHKKKQKNTDLDVSLESLDIQSLFADTSSEFRAKTQGEASSSSPEKRSKRKRTHSISRELPLDEIKLEADSDLEKIIGEKENVFD